MKKIKIPLSFRTSIEIDALLSSKAEIENTSKTDIIEKAIVDYVINSREVDEETYSMYKEFGILKYTLASIKDNYL